MQIHLHFFHTHNWLKVRCSINNSCSFKCENFSIRHNVTAQITSFYYILCVCLCVFDTRPGTPVHRQKQPNVCANERRRKRKNATEQTMHNGTYTHNVNTTTNCCNVIQSNPIQSKRTRFMCRLFGFNSCFTNHSAVLLFSCFVFCIARK